MFINRVKKYSSNLLLIAFLAIFCVASTASAQLTGTVNGSFEDFGTNSTPTTGSGSILTSTMTDWITSDSRVYWQTDANLGLEGFGGGTVWARPQSSKYIYQQVGIYTGDETYALSMTLVPVTPGAINWTPKLLTGPSTGVANQGDAEPSGGWVQRDSQQITSLTDPALTLIDAGKQVYQLDMTLSTGADATAGDLIWLQLDSYWNSYVTIDDVSIVPLGAPGFASDPISELDAVVTNAYNSTLADDASDPDGDPMTFSLVSPTNSWLNVATNGALSGTPTTNDVGVNVFTVQVDAIGGSDTATLSIKVVDPAASVSGVVNGGFEFGTVNSWEADDWYCTKARSDRTKLVSDGTGNIWASGYYYGGYYQPIGTYTGEETYLISMLVSDADGWTDGIEAKLWSSPDASGAADNIRPELIGNFSLLEGSGFILLDDFRISATATPNVYELSVPLSTGTSATSGDLLWLHVGSGRNGWHRWDDVSATVLTGAPPVFATSPIVKADVDPLADYALLSQTLAGSATDGDGDSLTYSKLSGSSWLTVAANGALSGIPAVVDSGTNTFEVLVEDGTGWFDKATLEIFVIPPGVAPVWSSDPVVKANGAYGADYGLLSQSLTNDATDGDGDPLTFTKMSGADWLVVAPDGSLSGTPDSLSLGTNSFSILVEDIATLSDTTTLEIFVESVGVAPVWSSDPIVTADGTYGIDYALLSQSLTSHAMDADGDSLTFTKTSGADWLVVAPDGALSGIPDGVFVFGTNSFGLLVEDGTGLSNTITLNVMIWDIDNQEPRFKVYPIDNFGWLMRSVTTSLNKSNATETIAYSGSLADDAADLEGDPMTFSKVSGPAWLNVASDGTLSGTPDMVDVGINMFVVQVEGIGGFSTTTLSIPVNGLGAGPYQANGIKIGEVDQTSAIIWTRLTTTGVADFNQMPCSPGMEGEVQVEYWPQDNPGSVLATSWLPVSAADDADYTLQIPLTGLTSGIQYELRVSSRPAGGGSVTSTIDGRFRTAPATDQEVPVLFTAVTGQMFLWLDSGFSGHRVYREMLALNPDFFAHTGDIIYLDGNINYNGSGRSKSVWSARDRWNAMFSLGYNLEFHRQISSYFEVDDHDALRNDACPGSVNGELTFEQGIQIFHEQTPSGPLPYRTRRWGKDLQVWMTENREFRDQNSDPDGPDKSIWGETQKTWFKNSVMASDATFKLLVSPGAVVGPDKVGKADNHANLVWQFEGDEIRQFMAEQNVHIVCGDRHWQYASIDPVTQVREYCTGAVNLDHAIMGGKAAYDLNLHSYWAQRGGFLSIFVDHEAGQPQIAFRWHDVDDIDPETGLARISYTETLRPYSFGLVTFSRDFVIGDVKVQFMGRRGYEYRVESADSMLQPVWDVVESGLQARDWLIEVEDTGATSAVQRFYRVVEEVAP